MAEVILDQRGGTATDVVLALYVVEANGIADVQVRDRMGIPLDLGEQLPAAEECPTDLLLDLGVVARVRLPLEVIVTDCRGEQEGFAPIGEPGERLNPSPGRLPCHPTFANPPSAACLSAQSELSGLASEMGTACRSLDHLRQLITLSIAMIAIALATILAGLLLVGFGASVPIFGALIVAGGLALIALGTFWLVSFERFRARDTARLRETEQRLFGLRTQFSGVARRVGDACCPEHITVNTAPPC